MARVSSLRMRPVKRLKQEILHLAAVIPRPVAIAAAVCFSGPSTGEGWLSQAWAQAPEPKLGSADGASTLRLVAEPGPVNGRYLAGVDLAMLPGSHTYWQIPGEAGVPPVFTFDGSENVRSATVKFPVPLRITEEGLDAFGYRDRVVFPVEVTPEDAGKPATLHVDVSYAVCNKLCLPGHGEASLILRPRAPGTAPELVAEALARVPRPVAAVPALHLVPHPAGPDATQASWTLTWTGEEAPGDIFPVAPEGYVFATKKTAPGAWTLTAVSGVTAPNALEVPVTLVLANEGAPTETTRSLTMKAPPAP